MNTLSLLDQRAKALDKLLSGRVINELSVDLLNARKAWAESVFDEAMRGSSFQPDLVELKKADRIIRNPIFIGGNPRSGTTLLRDLIDGHSSICVLPSEPNYFEFLQSRVAGLEEDQAFKILCIDWLDKLVDPSGQSPYWILSNTKPHSENYVKFIRFCRGWWVLMQQDHPKSLYLRHVAPFMLGFASFTGGGQIKSLTTIWLEKSPGIELYHQQLKQDFPQARFVNMVRNPINCFTSFKIALVNSASGNRIPFTYFLRSSVRYKALLSMNSLDHCITLKYENLADNIEDSIKHLMNFLRLEPEPINYLQTIASLKAYPNSSIVGEKRAKASLSKAEKTLLHAISNKVARYFNYPSLKTGGYFFSIFLLPLFQLIIYSYSAWQKSRHKKNNRFD